MSTTGRLTRLLRFLRSDTGRKLMRYGLASAVNVVVAEVVLAFTFGFLHWSARSAALMAASVAAIPAYWLARSWVWGRSGRSHLLKEVLPFWTLAVLGVAVTTWAADVAEQAGATVTDSRLWQTIILMGSVLAVSGMFWVLRFVVFNTIVFANRGPGHSRSPQGVR